LSPLFLCSYLSYLQKSSNNLQKSKKNNQYLKIEKFINNKLRKTKLKIGALDVIINQNSVEVYQQIYFLNPLKRRELWQTT